MLQTPPPEQVLTEIEDVFRIYGDMIFRLARLHTDNRQDAEDVAQDVLIRAMRNTKPFESPEHQKAWLIRVTLNCARTRMTSAWKRHTVGETGLERAAEEPEDFSDVYQAVHALDEKYRDVVHLFYYEDYSVKEIASILQTTESNVKSRLHRARETLRERLKGEYADV
ncbi:MAG: RNA polymerase sigma factor [Clostridia bacterium]|nr:RNA polymerase sigma factor [Clostridia bacterium]